MSQLGIGAILEVFGGGLLLLGLFTRPVAFLLSGEMAVAYFQFRPNLNDGLPAALCPLPVADLLQGRRAALETHRLEVDGNTVVCINSLTRRL